jgi:hypothetical protein
VVCLLAGVSFGAGLRLATPARGMVELAAGVPTQMSPAELIRYADAADREVYWLGPMAGRKLEVTEIGADGLFVRYLPPRDAIGDEDRSFTTVATYPLRRAYRVAVETGRRSGSVTEAVASGGIAVWRRTRPTSVYVAYPGSGVLVEIFDPRRSSARTLARSGRIARVK